MRLVSAAQPPGVGPSPETGETDGPDGDEPRGAPARRRGPWMWVSAVLAVIAVGLLVWALSTQSDLDSTQQDLAGAQQELDSTSDELAGAQQELDSANEQLDGATQELEELESQPTEEDSGNPGLVLAAGKALYDEFSAQLDAAHDDLAAAEREIEEAEAAEARAEQDAKAAEQDAAAATDETERANAQAEQAEAEADAAESRATAAAACARAYIAALGGLFEGESVRDQAEPVRAELSRVTADCQDQLGTG